MSDWPGSISAITVFTEDLPATKAFYRDVFGLPVHYEDEASAVFEFSNTLFNLLAASEAVGLIAPATPGGSGTPPRTQFTLEVDNVDVAAAELIVRGVELLNGPMNRPWGVRTAAFTDPAGTVWELAAPLKTAAKVDPEATASD